MGEKITITHEEFAKIASQTAVEEAEKGNNPLLATAFIIFAAKIGAKLFKEREEK